MQNRIENIELVETTFPLLGMLLKPVEWHETCTLITLRLENFMLFDHLWRCHSTLVRELTNRKETHATL
jgi:hypothetical protein